MITLNYDYAILYRSTSSAAALQLGGKVFYFVVIDLKTGDGGHRFAFASLTLKLDPDNAIKFYIKNDFVITKLYTENKTGFTKLFVEWKK